MTILGRVFKAIWVAVQSFVDTLISPEETTDHSKRRKRSHEDGSSSSGGSPSPKEPSPERSDESPKSPQDEVPEDEMTAEKWYSRAMNLVASGQPKEACEAAEKALDMGVKDEDGCRKLLVDAYEQLGWLDLAIKQMKVIVDKNPENHELRLGLAQLFVKRPGAARSAIQELTKVSEALPELAEVHAQLGAMYYTVGELENAKFEFMELERLAKNEANYKLYAMLGLAQTYCDLGEYDDAQAQIDRALAQSPGNELATILLSYLLIAQGRYQNALDILGKISPSEEHRPLFLCCRGYGLLALNNPDGAHDCFKEAAELVPDLVEAHHGLSLVYMVLGKPGLAESEVGRTLKLKPRGKVLLKIGPEFVKTPAHYGKYEVVQAGYSGGDMTRVHLAKHVDTGQLAVVKELSAAWSDSQEGVSVFERELQVTKMLDHPGIATIYHDGIDALDKNYYYVTEFAGGGTLEDIIAEEAPLSEDRVKQIGIELGVALDYCHTFRVPENPRLHVVHRDLKPSNILVMKDGSLKISDFGKVKLSETVAATGRTMSSCIDPVYASPEWSKGFTVDARTDIYSLGVILYELATGKKPHLPENPNIFAEWAKAKEELPVAPSELNPLISAGLDKIILKALEPDRNKRYQTANELVEDLKQCDSDNSQERGLSGNSDPKCAPMDDSGQEGALPDDSSPEGALPEDDGMVAVSGDEEAEAISADDGITAVSDDEGREPSPEFSSPNGEMTATSGNAETEAAAAGDEITAVPEDKKIEAAPAGDEVAAIPGVGETEVAAASDGIMAVSDNRSGEASVEIPLPDGEIGPVPEDSDKVTPRMDINSISSMLNIRTGPDLVMASCAYLIFVKGMDSFERSSILAEMKQATDYYRASHSKNLSATLRRLVKNGKLIEEKENVYSIEDRTKKQLEEDLAFSHA